MKPVEEAFASTGFRRVILPGIILTAGIHPLLSKATETIARAYGVAGVVLIVGEILFYGLVVSSALQWIYYVYEGFRLPRLTVLARRMNEARLNRSQQRTHAIRAGRPFDELSDTEKDEVTRIYEYLCDFPLRKTNSGRTEHYVDRPTRLGNLIATYELYPLSRYGIDGVFYWRHLLNLASDSARKQFEDQYAFSENMVLTSFSGAVIGLLHSMVLLGFGAARWMSPRVTLPFGPSTSAVLVLSGCIAWYLFYRAALTAHRDTAAAFRAIVDAVVGDFREWARTTTAPLPEPDRQRLDQLTEYLKALD